MGVHLGSGELGIHAPYSCEAFKAGARRISKRGVGAKGLGEAGNLLGQ